MDGLVYLKRVVRGELLDRLVQKRVGENVLRDLVCDDRGRAGTGF